ncbi:8782_t:CDS:2 [Paraglomus occultum]|uniref:Ribonuclease n=1 Tax=Paraglomus occultum TaxID=144539 RepID=A0A9N9CCP3_9GLOM|nr:8782_t:CDS:2 [Paraglomus occultum]
METPIIAVPSVNHGPLTHSYTYCSPKPHDSNMGEAHILGVDEAGRGPVLGPMVYGVCYCPLSKYKEVSTLGFVGSINLIANWSITIRQAEHWRNLGTIDSKTLKETDREAHFTLIQSRNDIIGWSVRVLSPQEISWNMLNKSKYNLNAQAHDATINLIREVLSMGINLREVYVDTVGPPESYQKKLSTLFPSIDITVSKQADSKYPIVSAASICAKITRDHTMKHWAFVEKVNTSRIFGSGYPSDPNTMAWLKSNIDYVFGYPRIIRFSWATCGTILEKEAALVKWPSDDNSNSQAINSLLQENDYKHKSKLFENMKSVNDF